MMMYPEGTEGAKTVSSNKHSVFGGQKAQSRGGEGDGVGGSVGASVALIRSFCFILRQLANYRWFKQRR